MLHVLLGILFAFLAYALCIAIGLPTIVAIVAAIVALLVVSPISTRF